MATIPHSATGLSQATTAAASNSSRPVGLVCEPCQAVGWVYAQYDDRWNTPIPLVPVEVRDIDGAVIDSGGRTMGLATFGLEDGMPHASHRHELGTYSFQAEQEGRIVVELVPEPSGPDPAQLEAQILADLDAFEFEMETALQPWIIAWEEDGVIGAITSFFRSIRSGASSWTGDQQDLWTAIGNWLSDLPEMAGDLLDGAVAGARALWEKRGEILGLIQNLARGLVDEFETGFEALLELVSQFDDLEHIATLMEYAYDYSAEWIGAMIEMARETSVLNALGGTMMAVLGLMPANFWGDMVGAGLGYLLPEIILAIIFALIAFFSAGLASGLLVTKITTFVTSVVNRIRAAGRVGSIVARIFDRLDALQSNVTALVRSLRSRIRERRNGATGEATPIVRSATPARSLDDLISNGTRRSADEVNAEFPEGYSPPYTPGTEVTEFVTDGNQRFVRVVSGDHPDGRWIMREADIAGLTPEQIADRFALPEVPSGITSITPPPGTRIRTGLVNPNFGGAGGATQFQLLDRVTEGWANVTPLR